jgi:hypothetical protein
MIKVQPARSRVVKVETPDRIALTSPPKGFISLGGLVLLIAVAWLGAAVWGCLAAFLKPAIEWEIISGVLIIPGALLLLAGLSDCWKTWTLERTADVLMLTRRGLWGTRVRSWPAPDISSFWVDDVQAPNDAIRSILIVGFRNGRSQDVMSDTFGDEIRWLAALLMDPRGSRRVVDQPALAAEPVRKRMDPSVVPPAVASRRFPTGVELTFLPLIDFKHRWWKLLGVGILGLALILGFSSLLLWASGGSYPVWITRTAVVGWLLVLAARVIVLKRSTVIQILDGLVTIVQNQHRGEDQFQAGEVEFIQTFRASGDTELQFLLKGKPKLRLLQGRPPDELEWAARFLRVALKGRSEETAAPLRVDAAVGDCQVCGEKMESRVVYCAKCRTPHHEECWSYVGQCSTYGCREIRFTRM